MAHVMRTIRSETLTFPLVAARFLEAAAAHALPELVAMSDLKGAFHCHTTWSNCSGSRSA